ncbi:hypothetical protein MNBD_GAMMA13-237, partial [hydrothermal vent metagenome]
SLDRKLSWRERLSIKVHLLMCTACRQMARQMQLLRSASRRRGSEEREQLQHTGQTHNKKS